MFANSSKVVLIDDHYDQIEPLIRFLNKLGVPYVYLNGKFTNIPDEPLLGVRWIFIDIELEGMNGQQDKTKSSALVNLLRQSISAVNGPCVFAFWTGHSDDIPSVMEGCKAHGIIPVEVVELDKAMLLSKANDGYIEEFIEDIKDSLTITSAINVYIQFEGLVNHVSTSFVHQFASLVNYDDNWSEQTAQLFNYLYTRITSRDPEDDDLKFKVSSYLMGLSYTSLFEHFLLENYKRPDGFDFVDGDLSNDCKAKLASWMYFAPTLDNLINSGYVFEIDNNVQLTNSLVRYTFKENRTPNNLTTCGLVVSPKCDIAQDKGFKHVTDEGDLLNCYNVIFGLLYPIDGIEGNYKNAYLAEARDSRRIIGPFWHNDQRYVLVLCLTTNTMLREDEITNPPILVLKENLLNSIQSNAASVLSRLGVVDFV